MTKITLTKAACTSDAAKALNSAFAKAVGGSIITIPDGEWPCHSPIELFDKNFTLHAEGVRLYPSDKYVVTDKPLFTYGVSDTNRINVRQQHIYGPLSILCGAKPPAVGLRSHNANFSSISDVYVIGFDVGIQQWATAYGFSFWNNIDRCQSACRTGFQQTGIPHPIDGLACSGTKINGFIGEWMKDMTCCFDLQGQGNSIRQAATEGPALKDLVKISGGGNNDIEFIYFEGQYPLLATSTAIKPSILRVYNRSGHAEWLTVTGNITVI